MNDKVDICERQAIMPDMMPAPVCRSRENRDLPVDQRAYYTLAETCARLGLCERTIRSLTQRGLLKKNKAVRRLRYDKQSVDSFYQRTC